MSRGVTVAQPAQSTSKAVTSPPAPYSRPPFGAPSFLAEDARQAPPRLLERQQHKNLALSLRQLFERLADQCPRSMHQDTRDLYRNRTHRMPGRGAADQQVPHRDLSVLRVDLDLDAPTLSDLRLVGSRLAEQDPWLRRDNASHMHVIGGRARNSAIRFRRVDRYHGPGRWVLRRPDPFRHVLILRCDIPVDFRVPGDMEHR